MRTKKPAIATLIALDATAVRTSVELVDKIDNADLTKPTPCADWTLYGLIAHMATQHYGFAAAATGADDLASWKRRPLGDDPIAAYRAAAEHVLAAFAAAGVADTFPLPELAVGAQFPAATAIGFHLVDYVVHSWDVARTIDAELDFAPEGLEPALAIAEAVPDGEARRAPGASFAPSVPTTSAARLDRIVAILGRAPDWPNPPS